MSIHLPSSLRPRALDVALFAGAAMAGVAPVADGDLYWHLAAGREMVRRGAVLASDPFSLSAGGREWIDVHWLFQLAVYAVYQWSGLVGIVLAKCALVGLGAVVLLRAAERRERTMLAIFLVGALVLARHLLLARPVIATLLFLAIDFRQLERFRRDGRAHHLWVLPVMQILWANTQGLFALGPALIAAYALGARSRERFAWLAGALAVGLLVSALTPFGVRGLQLPSLLFTRLVPGDVNVFGAVAENVPPFVLERTSPAEIWHLKWFLALLGTSFFVARRRFLLPHALIVVGFTALALMANRNVLLLYWMGCPIAARNWTSAIGRVRQLRARAARWPAYAALTALTLLAGVAAAREPTLEAPTPFRLPVESARIIEQTGSTGGIFSADHQGGYLIWKLYPRFRPYMDTRLVLRSPTEFADYLALADDPARFDELDRRYEFSFVVLPVVYPDRYQQLIAHLYDGMRWKLLFTDGSEVLFGRRSSTDRAEGLDLGARATSESILREIGERFARSPRLGDAARTHLATLDIVVGEHREAEWVLSDDRSPEAEALRARCRLAAADLEGAERIGQKLLQQNERDVLTLNLLASVSARRGHFDRAASLVRRALAIDPFDDEATKLLSYMEDRHENEHRSH